MTTTNKQLSLNVSKEAAGVRLDRFLADSMPSQSRSYWQRLIKDGSVLLDGTPCTINKTELMAGAQVSVDMPEEEAHAELIGENIPLSVLYEDDDMLVLDKPAGMVVHPAPGNRSGTLVNALAGRDPSFAEAFESELEGDANEGESCLRPGIVHRLDKDTSGCLVVAKNASSHFKLSRAFAERKVEKTYAAIVTGLFARKSGEINEPIGRHPTYRKKMAVNERGREALTRYKVLRSGFIGDSPVSVLEVAIMTGRTHQIRVHLAHIRHPVVGDGVYGGRQRLVAQRQMLHAWKLSVPRPADDKMLSFESPLPSDFAALAAQITDKPASGGSGQSASVTVS